MLPFARLGVPTHTSEMLEFCTASEALVVARRRPSRTISRTNSAIPSSTIVARPALTISTFVALTSTPMTSWPSFARHAAETQPT